MGWFIPVCIIAGLALALLLYYKSSFAKSKGIFSYPAILLISLRFLSITLLLFFLLSPMLKKVTERKEKPIVLIAIDNSKSVVLNKDSDYYKNEFQNQVAKFKDAISKRFEVQTVFFGDKITEKGKNDFSANRTNFSNLFNYLNQQYFNRNLGTVVVLSDGIYNEGKDPLALITDLKVPLYSVALGDTTVYKDLMIKEVISNSIAYSGNSFPVRIRIQAGKCSGSKAQLNVVHDNKVVASENFTINGNYFDKTMDARIDANKAGLQKYYISVSHLPNEINYTNNNRTVTVDVLENKKSVLFIAASPHPDVSAIKNSLSLQDNYHITTLLANDLPRTKPELEKLIGGYDVVMIHQLPARNNPARMLFEVLGSTNKPLFMVIGYQTSISQFNALETGLKIIQKKDLTNNVLPVIDNTFNYFNIADKAVELMPELPPLIVPFGEYKLSQESQILLKQRIGQLGSDLPLLVFINSINSRMAVLCGEGIWKWPLIEYKVNGDQRIFDDLMNKTIQFLSLKSDKRFFRFRDFRSSFYEDEQVIIHAEVLNQSYEMLKAARIKMIVTDAGNKKRELFFQETDQGYTLDLGYMLPGNYTYKAITSINGKEQAISGEFSVNTVDLEYLNTIADHNLLYKMAKDHEGKLFYPGQLKELADEINDNKNIKPMTFFESKILEFIEMKWIFFLILILLSAEWFFRKFYGSY